MKYFSPKKEQGTPSKAVKRPSNSDGEDESPSKQSRQECKYGANCYQKNPAHFTKFYHSPATPVADDGVCMVDKLHHEKTCFCVSENKGTDQLRCDRAADQRLCFRYLDSHITISLLPKSQI